jgi:hypothetical protein
VGVGAPVAILLIVGGICCFARSRKRRDDEQDAPRDTELTSANDSAMQSARYSAPPLVEDPSNQYAPIRVSAKMEEDDYAVGRFDTHV